MKAASNRRLPGLDGLRAIAVIGVLLYHAGVGWLPGGFLGVDLFFVISGFLITSLLLSEARAAGRVSLRQFYLRRARRLLPALVVMLAVVAVFMAIYAAADLGQARGDIAAALGYVSNWWYVLHHRSYFIAAGRPSPFQHLWSLAVEEQFYLIWPAVLVALVATRARLQWVTGVALAAALGSALWMHVLAVRGNVPFDTDSSRLYFGTDTHASALLLGAAAAAVMAGLAMRLDRGIAVGVRAAWDAVGVVALVAVCWSMHAFDYYRPGLYRGGFLAFAAVGVVVVVTASAPGGWLGRALDAPPMRWIGERSYGLYLWHWPVFVYTRPGLDWSLHGPAALAARLAIVALLTELSYRFVEVPLRREGVVSLARKVRMPRTWRVVAPVLSAVLGVAAVAGATTFVSNRIAHTQARARHDTATLGQGQSPIIGTAVLASPTSPTPAASPAATSVAASEAPATPAPTPELPVVTLPTHPPSRPIHPTSGPHAIATKPPTIPVGVPPSVSAVGDSVMLDAATALKAVCPGTEVYAVVGWQAKAVFAEVATLRTAAHLGREVVIETGTNGIVSAKELDATLTALADRQKVIVVNDHMDRPWEPPNNAMFPTVVKAHPNAVLVNWDTAANTHPTWLSTDGVHLRPAGRAPYAQLIKTAAAC
ncbi:MAG TPA: acyltransferase family protein [Acidothermaceae bacterium]|nr:acyltransferase family protein [Acidothermaceae bacterium]